jgi:hypothetical protein
MFTLQNSYTIAWTEYTVEQFPRAPLVEWFGEHASKLEDFGVVEMYLMKTKPPVPGVVWVAPTRGVVMRGIKRKLEVKLLVPGHHKFNPGGATIVELQITADAGEDDDGDEDAKLTYVETIDEGHGQLRHKFLLPRVRVRDFVFALVTKGGTIHAPVAGIDAIVEKFMDNKF